MSLFFGGDHDFHHHGDFFGHHDGQGHGTYDDHTGFRDFFSIRSLLLFGVGFGATGALSSYLGFGGFLIPVFGFVIGIFSANIGIKLFRFLMKQEGNTPNILIDLEGSTGRVITTIRRGEVGEVLVHDFRGGAQYLRARSEGDLSIEEGREVEVVSASGGELLVKEVLQLPPVV